MANIDQDESWRRKVGGVVFVADGSRSCEQCSNFQGSRCSYHAALALDAVDVSKERCFYFTTGSSEQKPPLPATAHETRDNRQGENRAISVGGDEFVSPTHSEPRHTQEVLDMAESYDIAMGGFLGSFTGGRGKALRLQQPIRLWRGSEEDLCLSGRYDPPGTFLLAFLLTIGTAVAVFALAQALGFMAGPGLLVWYLIIRHVRRRDLVLHLEKAKKVVIDTRAERLAFLVDREDADAWIAFRVNHRFDELAEFARAMEGAACEEAHVKRAGTLITIALLVLILSPFVIGAVAYVISLVL